MKVPEGSEVVYEWVSRTLEVMAFRDGGKVVTCSAICPHMGARLEVKRAWRGTTVRCPWHDLSFSLPEGRSDHPRYQRLRMIASSVEGDRIVLRDRVEASDAHAQDDHS
jgi:nitrite reductase/ring-hydroxylating ferredoxin subunit